MSPETAAPRPEAATPTVDATRASTRSSGLHGSLTVQAKLVVGSADDPAENEADHVAQQVVRLLRSPISFEGANERQPRVQSAGGRTGPIARVSSSRIGSAGGRVAPIARVATLDTRIRRMVSPIGAEGGAVDADTEREIQTARSGGAPLEGKIRRRMEDAMGADFSAVRVHVGAKSDQLNERIQAKAFTAGADIFVRRSEYAPDTMAGQQLLAHELTHTVQQGASPSALTRVTGSAPEQISRIMTVDEFKADTNVQGRRNRVKPVDAALTAYRAIPSMSITQRVAALGVLIGECDTYIAGGERAKRSPGVGRLRQQALLEQQMYQQLLDAEGIADPVDKILEINSALDLHNTMQINGHFGPGEERMGMEQVSFSIIVMPLIDGLSVADKQRLVQTDRAKLQAVHDEDGIHPTTKKILAEVLGNLPKVDLEAGSAGATKKLPWADEGANDYRVKHLMDVTGGTTERLGSMAHELTHVSVGESYDNTDFLLMIGKTATPEDVVARVRERLADAAELQSLLAIEDAAAERSVFAASQRSLLRNKVTYGASDKFAEYVNRFREGEARTGDPVKKEYFQRNIAEVAPYQDALSKAGLNESSGLLVEFDTVINQMLVYMHGWKIPPDHPFHTKLLTVGDRLYGERAAG